MSRIQLVRRLAALLLLASFFLPLSRCSVPATDDGSGKTVAPQTFDISGYSTHGGPVLAVPAAVVFGWAAVVQLFAWRSPRLQGRRWLFVLEIGLSVLSLAGISWLTFLWGQTMRYGAPVAYAAVLVYLLATVAGRRTGRPSL